MAGSATTMLLTATGYSIPITISESSRPAADHSRCFKSAHYSCSSIQYCIPEPAVTPPVTATISTGNTAALAGS